jgi:hypothetical protein
MLQPQLQLLQELQRSLCLVRYECRDRSQRQTDVHAGCRDEADARRVDVLIVPRGDVVAVMAVTVTKGEATTTAVIAEQQLLYHMTAKGNLV